MALTQDIDTDKVVRTTPYIRVVPNGFVLDPKNGRPVIKDGKATLKASLLMTPVQDDAAGLLNFVSWPNSVANLIENGPGAAFSIRFFPFEHGTMTDCIDPTTGYTVLQEDIRFAGRDFLPEFKDQSGKLTRLWQNSLLPKGGDEARWKRLLDEIEAILGGTRVEPGKIAEMGGDEAPNPAFGKDGQFLNPPPKEGRVCDTIMSIPRTDAAIVLEMQRAQELVSSLGDKGERTAELPETSPPVDPTQSGAEDDLSMTLDGIKNPVGGGSPSPKDVEEKIKNAIKARKEARFMALWESAKDVRAEARVNFDAACAALKSDEPANICNYTAESPSKAAAEGAKALKAVRARTEYAQWPQYVAKGDKTDGTPSEADKSEQKEGDRLSQTYFGIEGNPGLSRAFGLSFDLEIDLPESIIGNTVFALLNAQMRHGASAAFPKPWSLTKLRRYGASGPNLGWPATESEFFLWCKSATPEDPLLASHCVPQFEGVVNMGGIPAGDGTRLPRYDIATLDVSAALDAEQNWLEAIEERRREDKENPDRSASKALQNLLSVGPDYQSNGLTLLCRSAASDAIRKLAAIQQKLSTKADGGGCIKVCADGEYVIHDAEDLTNGLRVIVGVPETGINGPTEWRPLMGRFYRYGGSGKGGDVVESVLEKAVGPAGSPARVAIESAMQAVPARDIGTRPAGAPNVETVVEEAVNVWDGTPSGVPCGRVLGLETQDLDDAMCFGRRVDLPRSGSVTKPPPLRNGRPYRFGLQAVFAGGRSINIDQQPVEDPSKEDDVRARLYYPSRGLAADQSLSVDAVPYVRCLRHARVGAPSLLTPVGHAKRKNGPMGFESAGKMIVRTLRSTRSGTSAEGRNKTRDRPRISQRLIVVPNVSLDMAARHHKSAKHFDGVFDTASTSRAPAGGLKEIKYARYGRFPTAVTTTKPGINGAPYIDDRKIIEHPNANVGMPGEEDASSLYIPRFDQRLPPTSYYPDPAADNLVIRVRRTGTETADRGVLPGAPLVVSLKPSEDSYPNFETVLLTLDRGKNRLGPPSQENILRYRGRRWVRANRSGDISTSVPGRHRAIEVELRLDPGDQYEIEMWIAPSDWRLAHDFAQVQSMAHYFCRKAPGATECTTQALKDGIKSIDPGILPLEKKTYLLKHLETEMKGSDTRYIGPGGDALPEIKTIRALGHALHHLMLCHPLPEISGVRRIAAVHAVNVPAEENTPVIAELAKGVDPFPDPLCATRAATVEPEPLRAIRPAELGVDVPGFSDAAAIASGSKLMALKGQVKIDPERVDTLEIVARTVSPHSAIFDNPARGRSLARRLAGTWPEEIGSKGVRKARDIFGFRLSEDGRSELDDGQVTLLRIDNLPFAEPGDNSKLVDLGPYFLDLLDLPTAGSTSRRHAFPDGKARRLEVRVNALARTAEQMATAARVARAGDPWLDRRFSGLVYEQGELIPSETLPRPLMESLSEPIEVILPATVRPATVKALVPVPVFEDQKPPLARTDMAVELGMARQNAVRLTLGRGWFSSGIDERLGIVLWPPHQQLADHPKLAGNTVPLRSDTIECDTQRLEAFPGGICPGNLLGTPPPPGPVVREVDLQDFEDDDLGPGGRFVTRRGMDPVRMSENVPAEDQETQVFLSKEAFPDLWRHPADPNLAEYIPQTWMPLSETPEEAELETPGAAGKAEAKEKEPSETEPPISVGLVAYRPLFDPEREQWYVDVTLRPGIRADSFVRFGLVRYQPNTRPDLRCSHPTVQWAQPLPDRQVTLKRENSADHLEIDITGPVAKGRARVGVANSALEKQMEKRDAPVMRLTLFQEGYAPAGAASRATVDLSEKFDGNHLEGGEAKRTIDVIPAVLDGIGRWKGKISLADLPPLTSLRLAVDEIEYFPPASFPRSGNGADEPLDIKAIETFQSSFWLESGPRFSTTFDLSQMQPAMAGRD